MQQVNEKEAQIRMSHVIFGSGKCHLLENDKISVWPNITSFTIDNY
jgi:hypothetical protein